MCVYTKKKNHAVASSNPLSSRETDVSLDLSLNALTAQTTPILPSVEATTSWDRLQQHLDNLQPQVAASPPNLHASNGNTPSTSSACTRSPSVISTLISQDIYLCTTIDLLAAEEGSGALSFAYFHQSVESPFITPYDPVNWVLFKDRVVEVASQNATIAAAIIAVQSLYKARKHSLPQSKPLSLYKTATVAFEEAFPTENDDANLDIIFMTVFLLCFFEMLVPEETNPGPFLRFDGVCVRQLETWSLNEEAQSALSLRIASWLLVSHAAARRSGNRGLLSGIVHDLLEKTCSRCSQLPQLDINHSAPLDTSILLTLAGPYFTFYFQLQLLSAHVADLSHYHRSRTTGVDQEEVSVLMSSLKSQIETLWENLPMPMRRPPDELRAQVAAPISEPLIALGILCSLTYHTEIVEIGRNLSDAQLATPEARAHLAHIRDIISSGDEHLCTHPAFLRPLFLYAIESLYESETQWAVCHMRKIKDPICYSDFFATFAEGLAEEQRSKGRRVTTRWWCWKAFGATPPFL